MGKDLYTASQFIEAIKGSGGIISTIAKRVGCEWHTAKKYIEQYSTVKQAYINETEAVTDMAEIALINSIKNSDAWAVKYYLSTKGKDRGYVERQELTGAEGGAIAIKGYTTNANPDDWDTDET